MSKLKGKTVVVTGASKGIGAGIAKSMAGAGAQVVVNYASSKEGADRVVNEIKQAGGNAIAVHGDMSKAGDIARLFQETQKAFGSVDVLVNNAGVFKFHPVEEITEEEFHRQFNTNVLGPILAVREGLKYFGPEGGSVINVSSVVSDKPVVGSAVYSGTKSALDAVTKVLSQELGSRKIRVNSILPGGVDTEGTQALGMIGGDLEKAIIAQTPLGRIGQPDDIARVAVFLASDDAAWISGQKISVSGGY